MPRPLRTLLVGIALLVAGVLASSASAASFSYNSATHVLQLTGAAGETIGIETTGAGEYLASGTLGGPTTGTWVGTNRTGLYADPTPSATYSLSIDANTVPLDRIEILDDTGPITLSVAGGLDPYITPVSVALNNVLSTARIDRSSGSPISFGTTWLAVVAPSITVMNSITAAEAISLEATTPILLGNGGSEPSSKSLTATTLVATTPINGNGKDLTVTGPWLTEGVSAAHTIRAESGVTTSGNLGATSSILLGNLVVDGPAYPARTVTAPSITLLGSLHQRVGCASAEITCRSLGATGPAAGAGIKFAGAVTAQGAWSNLGNIEVTGVTHLAADISDVWNLAFGDTVYLSGAATRSIQADNITAGEGIKAEPNCVGGAVSNQAICNTGIASLPVRTSNLMVDGAFSTNGTTYMPGDITLKGITSVLSGNPSTTASLNAGGTLDIAGGLSVLPTSSAFLTGATTILAGMPPTNGVGSIGAADACEGGPVTVTGDLRVTAPIECVGSLTTVLGSVTLGANVTSDRFQSYTGPTTVALGSGSIRLRSESGALVNFPEGGVSASWSAAAGDIASYTATAQPSGASCTWTSGPLTCALGAVPSASDMQFSVTSTPRPASTPSSAPTATTDGPLPTGRTSRRTVARGSRTPLTRLIVPPASRGKRTWSETGPCTIRSGRLVAPTRAGTCKIALRVAKYRTTPAWTGRVTVTIK